MHLKNNFDFLRLMFSFWVVYSHAFPQTGQRYLDWLFRHSGQVTFSKIGVAGFFVISGYLVFQSMERSSTWLGFLWKRFLRLYPAFIVVLLLTVILGPIVYQNAETPYWQNSEVFSYIHRNLRLYPMQYGISGIFSQNPMPDYINGSLWTLVYEFSSYLFLALIFMVRKNRKLLLLALLTTFAFYMYAVVFPNPKIDNWQYGIIQGFHFVELGAYFVAGSLLGFFKVEKWRADIKNALIILSFLAIIISLTFGAYKYVGHFALPLFSILFGLASYPIINQVKDKIGDISYGMYIYAFPIQQTLSYYYPKLSPEGSWIFGGLLAGLFGYASWHLIEKRALKFKKLFDLKSYKN